ncbi:tetrathionate reductase subunit A [Edwardsiella tarda]|uniref:tetrathionate reductase subunit A n=1 Tax=Edwardsiella tarda TaxID=636 RepID=UPI0039BEC5D0
MDKRRRQLLKLGLAAGGGAVFAAGYAATARHMAREVTQGTAGEPTRSAQFGNALQPEMRIDADGRLQVNPQQRLANGMCFGCWTLCGIRMRIDNRSERILRIAGNPYHPLSQQQQLPYATPLAEAWRSLAGEAGLAGRSTACARGNAMLEIRESPYRITQPMKRVGKRGEGRWQTISYEQLLHEICEGGDLFGEGPVEGLRALRDLQTPLDPAHPEFGPRANQLLVTNAGDEGRDHIIKRFAMNSFGSRNFGHHGSYCGYAFRAGSGALMQDLEKNAHMKPDLEAVEFVLYIGTSPAQSGNPFKRQARQLAAARSQPGFSYVVVAPSQPLSTSLAAGANNRWIPIRSGSDAALALAMIRWIIEQQRYNADYLSQPSEAAMQQAGQAHWCNATHLVICQPGHPREGQFLTRADLAETPSDALSTGALVLAAADGALADADIAAPARLWVDSELTGAQGPIRVKSALTCLRDEAQKLTLAQYSAICGVPEAEIVALARQLTSHGTRAAVDTHGGTMHANGFYTAYAILMLNVMIGNINLKGGMMAKPPAYPAFGKGPCYNFDAFPGKVKPRGLMLSRSKASYEQSREYQEKVAAGQSPYPARAPWYPLSSPLLTEQLSAALAGYPYRLKAWINHLANPLYGVPGLRALLESRLRDPAQLPLIVAVDAFLNETTALADYLVPDTVTYESWGIAGIWQGVPTRAATARWPAVTPLSAKTADGRPLCLENFLIDVAKRLSLPGFGPRAQQNAQGEWLAIDSGDQYYLRAVANLAFVETAVAPATAEDMALSGVDRLLPTLQATLPAQEIGPVASVLARGGRFEDADRRYQGEWMTHRYRRPFAVWNAQLAAARNSMTGERYCGCPTWMAPRLADGTPLRERWPQDQWPFELTSYKSNIHSALSALSPRLCSVKRDNPLYLHPQDGARWGIANGDWVEVTTPGGTLRARAMLLESAMPGVIAIEHGYGHWELGARSHIIDGVAQPEPATRLAGVSLNQLGLVDPTRQSPGVVLDWVVGAAARQGLPARIRRVTA